MPWLVTNLLSGEDAACLKPRDWRAVCCTSRFVNKGGGIDVARLQSFSISLDATVICTVLC